ncbi:hypothetical protein ACTMU2_23825 [Cupriavidus basilensis]
MKPHLQKSHRLYRTGDLHGRSRFYVSLLVVLCLLGFIYLLVVLHPRLAW